MRPPDIPDYRIKAVISRDQLASVFRATHTLLSHEVALKVITNGSENIQKDTIKRFLAKAQISANLQHDHIINIYDTGKYKNFCYFSMECLPRGSLRQKLKGQTRPSLDWSVKVILQIASALSYTHARGYVHHNIKPENILFREAEHVVLSDFGIARSKSQNDTATPTALTQGATHYMAPEQALGQQTDARSDIYSLGVIFYELLIGQLPHPIDSDDPTRSKQIQNTALQLPKKLEAFEPILEKLLATNPEHRFQTIDTFRTRLQEIQPAIYTNKPTAKTKVEEASSKKTYHKLKVLVPSICLSLFLLPAFSIHSPPIKLIEDNAIKKDHKKSAANLTKQALPTPPVVSVRQPVLLPKPITQLPVKSEAITTPTAVPTVTTYRHKEKLSNTNKTASTALSRKIPDHHPDQNVITATLPITPPTIPSTPKPEEPATSTAKNKEEETDLNCILKLKSCNRQDITGLGTKE